MKSIVVVYDFGSVGPVRIAEICNQFDVRLLWYAAHSTHAQAIEPLLSTLGHLVNPGGTNSDIDWLALAHEEPSAIITFSEWQLELTALLAEKLGLRYNSPAAVHVATHKDKQRAALQKSGLGELRFGTVRGLEQCDAALKSVGIPCVAKPISGTGSRSTVILRDIRTAREILESLLQEEQTLSGPQAGLIVEEYIVGRGASLPWADAVALDCAINGDHIAPVLRMGKLSQAAPARDRGGFGPLQLPPDELQQLDELAASAIRAVGLTSGIAQVEISLTEFGPRVIEVNGRLGGWVDDLTLRSGLQPAAEIAVGLAFGQPVPPESDTSNRPKAYQYYVIPPMDTTIFVETRNLDVVRSWPSVQTVQLLRSPGTDVSWVDGSFSAVCLVSGVAEDIIEFAEVVQRIEEGDYFIFE